MILFFLVSTKFSTVLPRKKVIYLTPKMNLISNNGNEPGNECNPTYKFSPFFVENTRNKTATVTFMMLKRATIYLTKLLRLALTEITIPVALTICDDTPLLNIFLGHQISNVIFWLAQKLA